LPATATWSGIAYGAGYFVIVSNANNVALYSSSAGSGWRPATLPSSAAWSSVAYGNGTFVTVCTGALTAAYSTNFGQTWTSTSLATPITGGIGAVSVAYGSSRFVAVAANGQYANVSGDGVTWFTSSVFPNITGNWSSISFGNGRFVIVSSTSNVSLYSLDGFTWQTSSTPITASLVTYGQGTFLALNTSNTIAYISDSGLDWKSKTVSSSIYGACTFGLATTTSSSTIPAVSLTVSAGIATITYATQTTLPFTVGGTLTLSGFSPTQTTSPTNLVNSTFTVLTATLTQVTFALSGTYASTVLGTISGSGTVYTGTFAVLGGQNSGSAIIAGVRAKGRPNISSNVLNSITHWEPGSGYSSTLPLTITLTVTDPNVTTLATLSPRIGNGSLGAPSFVATGTGYNNASTIVTINGNGYSDSYQTGYTIILNNLSRTPLVGDNLTITGVSQVYKVTSASVMFGTSAPNIEANVQISPSMTSLLSPPNGTGIQIRTKYSQVRLTGHDFLYIGTGNFNSTNYPSGVSINTTLPQNQTVELNYGRVFYTSTDQDGNFKVGTLFGVQQATGIVTLSASQFGLSGLSTLSLGGVALGASGVSILGFSTDGTFTANSDSIIPTQKAIKSYITGRLTQGGSNTSTGQLTAGTVVVGGAQYIKSSLAPGLTNSNVKISSKMYINGSGVDGNMAALDFFMRGITQRNNF
jgi:hypothetical protein